MLSIARRQSPANESGGENSLHSDETADSDDESLGIRREYRDYLKLQLAMSPVSNALAVAGKTYAEIRSWTHVCKNFFPVLQFYIVTFHILVSLAFVLNRDNDNIEDFMLQNNLILSSFAITYIATSIGN